MNLHDLKPPVKHSDVPLWTKDRANHFDHEGDFLEIYGTLDEAWLENNKALGLWNARVNDENLSFIIWIEEFTFFKDGDNEVRLQNYMNPPTGWYIGHWNTIEERP